MSKPKHQKLKDIIRELFTDYTKEEVLDKVLLYFDEDSLKHLMMNLINDEKEWKEKTN